MSSWDFNAPQYVDFNKTPKDENIDSYFDLDHENKAVNELANALNSSKLSDDCHSDDSGQPLTSMLQDKTNKLLNNQSSDGEYILANLCASQKEWNNKAKVTISSSSPSRISRPLVKPIKSKGFRQHSPCRSPLAKRICPTSNPTRSPSDRRKLLSRSQSAVTFHKVEEEQKYLPCNDNQPETAERSSLGSSIEPLSHTRIGKLLCSERSQSLPSVARLSQNCLDLRSMESNPVSRSRTDLDGNSKLTSANQPIPSDANVGKKNLSQADKVSQGHVAGGSTLKSSEQLELEKMEQLKKDLERKRKIAQMSMAKALAVHNQPEIHSTKETTKPVQFNFATDNRFKEPTKEKSGPLHQEKDFVMLLRHPDPPLTTRSHRVTIVQPFNLTADKKRKREDPKEAKSLGYKFQTMGEKLLQFCTKTPERFRRKKGQTDPPSPHASDVRSRITVAKTPNLRTKTRHRKVDALSREEQEELEVQEMKKHQFKAVPLNKKILDQQDQLKFVPVKPRTAVEPFKLTTVVRRSEGNLSSNEETRYEFHAQPIPKAVFEPETFVKKEVFKCTVPQSPAFSWKKNVLRTSRTSESSLSKLVKEETMFKAPPVPNFDEPFHPVLPHRHTEPQPFSFEERMKESIVKKEKTIQKILEEEAKAREFVANPIPDLSPVLPTKKSIPVTDPVPFNLLVDERGAEKARKFEEKLEEEDRQSREAATFRAQPATVLHKDPFVPQKVAHPSVEPEPFKLQTEERTIQRKQWEMWKKEKEEAEELQRQERERKRLEEEEAEIQQLRRDAVHQANPIRRYKRLEDKEVLPLTEPQSPDFSERLKPRK